MADPRVFTDAVFEQLARVGKAVSAPKRLELIDLLAQGPRTVDVLAGEAAISVANASQHLQVLRAARLVEAEKKGVHVEYRLADEEVGRFFVALRSLAESRLAEIDQLTHEHGSPRGGPVPVETKELIRRVKGGEVTVLDVRPAEEFRAGHLQGALSVPVSELRARMGELPRDRAVVAYGRGRFCTRAMEAVELLRKNGLEAHRLELGVVDWRARGWWLQTPRVERAR